ncbi:hypothetical protein, partial [Salipiger thiooxidans]|uniref:hypothetical protein n=1 Tax=Salipiger thiooxidans TaxID=282683 RepID=UPI001CD333F2
LGPAAMQRLGPDDATRLRVRLDRFERRARALLEPHRDLGEADLRPWLADLPVDKTAGSPA